MTPRVISLFSGVGTFDHGFHLAGWETVHLCEWDPKAREVLSARFPGVPISPDVCEINGADLPDAELIMFGSPCQDLSVAGKRAGLAGEKSGLFTEAIRIIKEKREATNGRYPAFALWENVPGALSSNGGRDFSAVIHAFLDSGARDCCWRVLDAQFFGVPQRRRRIFLVADFGGERAREVLFEPESVPGHPQASRNERQDAPAPAGRRAAGGDRTPDAIDVRNLRMQGGLSGTLQAKNQGGHSLNYINPVVTPQPAWEPARALLSKSGWRGDGESDHEVVTLAIPSGIASTLTTEEAQRSPRGDGSDNLVVAALPVLSFQQNSMTGRGTLGVDEQTTVLRPVKPQEDHQMIALPPAYAVRRLTPEETEALQGMPRGWTALPGMADSHRYRFMGNGGAAPVLRWIGERMKAVLA